jgi:Tfp pilus assembly protein PilF
VGTDDGRGDGQQTARFKVAMKNGADGDKILSPCRQVLFAFTVLAILLLIIYGNSFTCSWHFDDVANITGNTAIHLKTLSWNETKRLLLSGHLGAHASARPLAYLSFGLNYFFGGLDVFGYHLVNLSIHFVASLFLFFFIRNAARLELHDKTEDPRVYHVALLSAVLWAVHPIQTQAVTYIVQRMTSLAGMFTIMSLYFYLKARTSLSNVRAALSFTACLLTFLMALGSKENGLLLLLSLALCEALLIKGPPSWTPAKKWALFIGVIGTGAVMGFLWVALTKGDIFSALFAGYDHRPFTLWQRVLTESRVVLFYLSLMLYPMPDRLSLVHGFQISTSLLNPVSTLLSVLSILGIVGLLVVMAKKHPLLSFCFLFFFVNHLMESTLLPLELVYEHRNYIPSMLFFVPFAMGFCFLLERFQAKRGMRVALCLFGAFTLMGFAHAAYERNLVWKTPETLWFDTLKKAPLESRVRHNLGSVYQDRSQLDKAKEEYEKALSLNNYPRRREEAATYFNLGNLHRDLDNPTQAEVYYQKAVQADPNCYPALNSLAVLYEREGRKDAVLPALMKALKAEPESSSTNYNLGLFHLKNGDLDKAVPYFDTAIRDPGIEHSVRVSLGVVYKQKGLRGKALVLFKQALATNPRDVVPRLHLMELYHSAGLEKEALDQGRGLLDLLLKDEALFYNTIGFVVEKGRSREVALSSEAILPLLYQAMSQKGDIFDGQVSYLKKLLDKDSKIE